jgi:hypothetical protein
MESKHQGPRVRKRKLSGTKSAPNTQTLHTHTTSLSIKVRSVRARQHRPPRSLGKQQRTGAIHITLTLNKSTPQSTPHHLPPGVTIAVNYYSLYVENDESIAASPRIFDTYNLYNNFFAWLAF